MTGWPRRMYPPEVTVRVRVPEIAAPQRRLLLGELEQLTAMPCFYGVHLSREGVHALGVRYAPQDARTELSQATFWCSGVEACVVQRYPASWPHAARALPQASRTLAALCGWARRLAASRAQGQLSLADLGADVLCVEAPHLAPGGLGITWIRDVLAPQRDGLGRIIVAHA